MQPNYSKSIYKNEARRLNIQFYRKIMDRNNIPSDRSYWTLCHLQSKEDGSEIIQAVKSGLITTNQFHGVDRDKSIIVSNKRHHPEANWHHGDWIDVIENVKDFNPAMIYLDTTSFIENHVATNLITRTMMLCHPHTIIFANFMLNDPRSQRRFNPKVLLENISKQIPRSILQTWHLNIPNYNYRTSSKTLMKTYIFVRNKK